MTGPPDPGQQKIREVIAAGWAAASAEDPEPTVRYFAGLLREHPDNASALLEYAGALDFAGRESEAAPVYQQALAAGLAGDELRQALTQYGSTLRNIGRHEEAVARLIRLALDRINAGDLAPYQRALRHYASGLEPPA
jgi:tetratricopeptide (TPR) repeat protein